MTKPNQEVKKIKQLSADPWAISVERHKPVKNAENYLFAAIKNMLEHWYNDVNAQRANQ